MSNDHRSVKHENVLLRARLDRTGQYGLQSNNNDVTRLRVPCTFTFPDSG